MVQGLGRAKINLVGNSDLRSNYPMHKQMGAPLIVFLLFITGCAGVRNQPRSTTPLISASNPESRYIEDSSDAHPKPVAVVFVHGLFGSDLSWGKGDFALPHLLATDPELQPQIDTFFFEYKSPLLGEALKIPSLSEQLSGALEDNHVWANHERVIFVAHSMGGLIVRQYLIAHPEHLQKMQMLYFYAVPTGGAKIADIATVFSRNSQLNGLGQLEFNNFLDAVTNSWRDQKKLSMLPTYCAFESKNTYGIRVVPEISAEFLCTEPAQPMDGNHLEIVKPQGPKDPRFTRLATAIKEQLKVPLPSPGSVGARLGIGPEAYATISDIQVGQWIMDEAEKVDQMVSAAFAAISSDRQRGGDGGYPINRFGRDFIKCCKQEIADLRTEAFRRLGPPAHDNTEEELWNALSVPNPPNFPSPITPPLVQMYLPHFRSLGFHLKRKAVPRAANLYLPFTVQRVSPEPMFPYSILLSVDTEKQLDSGYIVVYFEKAVARLGPDPNHGLLAIPDRAGIDNKELLAALDNHSVTVYALKIGAIPFKPHDPIHISAGGALPFRILSVSWFDE
jgi:hypothetical protein